MDKFRNLSALPFMHPNGIAVMPDVHDGKGSAVGTVIATERAIIPAAVGVDIGCVDMDSEYLSQNGWRRISEYDGGHVMQYNPETGEGQFVEPQRFIKRPSSGFLHFKTKYGVDQMLSRDHKVLCWKITGRKRERVMAVTTAKELAKEQNRLAIGAKVEFQTTFKPQIKTSLPLSDAAIRLQVAVHADGCLVSNTTCVVSLVKERKKIRLRQLLNAADVSFTENDYGDRTSFRFAPPRMTKVYSGDWWEASLSQLQVVADECLHWDGNTERRVFFTRDKSSADFIQYAFTASGYRGTMRSDDKDGDVDYRVFANTNVLVGLCGVPKSEVSAAASLDGFEYCFTVPSGFWVMRRGGNVVMTGNCGMIAQQTTLRAEDLPDSLREIRLDIVRAVPHGFETISGISTKGAFDKLTFHNSNMWRLLRDEFDLIVQKHPMVDHDKVAKQLGTLGGGNHFVELCIDENGWVWVMIHSGSRGVGNRIGQYFVELAREDMRIHHINLPDKDLAYLSEGTQHFSDYVSAMNWAQDYALENRVSMMLAVLNVLRSHLKPFQLGDSGVNCHHNYTEIENHFGSNVWVTRKGAVRARKGDLGIIPGSMGQKSYIVRGKGNAESYNSCSHGAGRIMSRKKAKETFTIEDLKSQTEGVECDIDEGVIDEIPGAYKNLDEVMDNQKDLVEVVHTLKAVLCVKGKEEKKKTER